MAVPPAVVVAGTYSGVGKTSVAVGLMAALTRRGLNVQPFKVGPDFLDPMHHEAACGRPSINLDGWMLDKQSNIELFRKHASGADVAVVEGVMGLYDGRDGRSEVGSTAEMSKWLRSPVVLVLDCWALARSAAALALGFTAFDTNVTFAGLVLNKVGGKAHAAWLREALESALPDVCVLGAVPKDNRVVVPERHLGLHMPAEVANGPQAQTRQYLDTLATLVEDNLDLDALLQSTSAVANISPDTQPALPSITIQHPHIADHIARVRIGVARDAAFCFYYHENLFLLQEAGAELVYFSPIMDSALPSGVTGLYFGGGYPELHAADLAANMEMRAAVRDVAAGGGIVYGECGGLMYLSQSLQTKDGGVHSMCGVLPFRTRMVHAMKMGYVEVETQDACTLFPSSQTVRGQVYHFSEIVPESLPDCPKPACASSPASSPLSYAYSVRLQQPNANATLEGYQLGNALASYVHLHWGSNPRFAASLVSRCRDVAELMSHQQLEGVRMMSPAAASNECGGDVGTPTTAQRICSLLPSGTEILHALGVLDRVIGISDFCDFPSNISEGRHVVSRSAIRTEDLSSKEIEQQLRKIKESGAKLFSLDADWIADQRPDLILTQDTCAACDVDTSEVARALALAKLAPPEVNILTLRPRTVGDMLDTIHQIGDAVGAENRATALVDSLKSRLDAIAQAVASVPSGFRPRVLSLEGLSPIVLGGHWLGEMKTLAGGRDELQEPGCAARRIEWDEVVTYAPEVLILAPCSSSQRKTMAEIQDLVALPGWWSLPAVRTGQVYICESALFSRPGPRLINGVEMLARILHPQLVEHTIAPGLCQKLTLVGEACEPHDIQQHFTTFT
eukprot:jgi/Chlat1/3948/Chrsp26S04208